MKEINNLLLKVKDLNLIFEWSDPQQFKSGVRVYNEQDIYEKDGRTIVYDITISFNGNIYEIDFSLIPNFDIDTNSSINEKDVFIDQESIIDKLIKIQQTILNC